MLARPNALTIGLVVAILAVTLVAIGVIAGGGLSRAASGSHGDLLLTYDLTSTDTTAWSTPSAESTQRRR